LAYSDRTRAQVLDVSPKTVMRDWKIAAALVLSGHKKGTKPADCPRTPYFAVPVVPPLSLRGDKSTKAQQAWC
jgi:hypothetical protein